MYTYIYMYMYICIYVYIYMVSDVWRLLQEELLNLSIPTAERGVVAMGWESSSSGLRRGWHKAGDIAGYSSWLLG